MENLIDFKLWLKKQHYSSSTIRNYLVDVGKYLSSGLEINQYLLTLKSDPNYPRYVSSLKKYLSFISPPTLNLTDYIFQYKTHLEKHHAPVSTVRNYLNDLIQYVTWLESDSIEPQSTN